MIGADKPTAPRTRAPQKGHRARRWIPYAGAVVLVGLILAGLWPRPVPVETAVVELGNLRATVNEEGKTRIRNRYLISAPITGQLRRIPFKAGASVEKGKTVLAVIDPVAPTLLDARTRLLAQARRDTAAANLDKARSTYTFALSELKRNEKLFAGKTVSVQELEAAQWRESAAGKDQAAAESALRQAEAELAEFNLPSETVSSAECPPKEVKAPVNGRVLRIFEESTRVVASGTPLMEIGDPTDLEVVVEALSRDGAAITNGAKAEFEQWGGKEPLIGRVRLVEPAAFTKISALGVEEQRVNVIADLITPAEQRPSVGDNFRVEARIVVWEAPQVIKIPTGALFRRGDVWAVFVVEGGRVHLRPIKPGMASGTETQVLDGVKPGEKVVLYPGRRVQDGQRVTLITI